jgi:hypothetical protein
MVITGLIGNMCGSIQWPLISSDIARHRNFLFLSFAVYATYPKYLERGRHGE